MHQYILDLVRLFNPDTDSYAVDAGLNEHFLVFVAGDGQWIEEDFGGASCFDLGDVVSF